MRAKAQRITVYKECSTKIARTFLTEVISVVVE